ncbi:hypothetical protein BCR44DRAFT_1433904 [Catenaria anguillulae PL171]|uniref:Uncharacterized protein n=1 Tax=Catenaria anguillulae PL171 TaxID=765915 RepID=A0A1Y2HR90_9FUNG|nr:hypothetical protein BCR44DRAFT_1433904 [Catenaria anguillulae PL171]
MSIKAGCAAAYSRWVNKLYFIVVGIGMSSQVFVLVMFVAVECTSGNGRVEPMPFGTQVAVVEVLDVERDDVRNKAHEWQSRHCHSQSNQPILVPEPLDERRPHRRVSHGPQRGCAEQERCE